MKKTADVPMKDCVSPEGIRSEFPRDIAVIAENLKIAAGHTAPFRASHGFRALYQIFDATRSAIDSNVNRLARKIEATLNQQRKAGALQQDQQSPEHWQALGLSKSADSKMGQAIVGMFGGTVSIIGGFVLNFMHKSIPIEWVQDAPGGLFFLGGIVLGVASVIAGSRFRDTSEDIAKKLHRYIRANINTAVTQAIEAESDAESEEPTSPSAATQTSD